MVRTLAEVHADRVTVTVTLNDAPSSLAGRLYTAEEVGDFQASEAELVAQPLRTRINALENRVRNLDLDRHTERDRADKAQARVAELERALALSIERENKLESDLAEEKTIHARSLAARDHLLAAATTQINLAREALTRTPVAEARENIVTTRGAVLAEAIRVALGALDRA
jgi:hypothetical protein